jgi:hypothetical protein
MIHSDDLAHPGPDLFDELLDDRSDVARASADGASAWKTHLAALFATARGPADPAELADEERIVGVLAETIHDERSREPAPYPTGRVVRRVLAAKATVATVIALGVATAAAAAGVTVHLVAPGDDQQPHHAPGPTTTAAAPGGAGDDGQSESPGASAACRVVVASCTAPEPSSPANGPDASTGSATSPRPTPDRRANQSSEVAPPVSPSDNVEEGSGDDSDSDVPTAPPTTAPTTLAAPAVTIPPAAPASPGPPLDPGSSAGPPADAGQRDGHGPPSTPPITGHAVVDARSSGGAGGEGQGSEDTAASM